MLKQLSYSLLFLALSTSCQSGADDVRPVQPADIRADVPGSEFLRTSQASAPAAEYISGEFNGHTLYCADDKWPSLSSTFHNNPAQDLDNGYLIRENPQGDVQLNLTFSKTNLFQQAMPAFWPHANPAVCEQILLEVRNLAPDNTELAYFSGGSSYGIPLKVQITSIAHEVVEGTFEGRVSQYVNGKYTGYFLLVKNGKFRIKTHTLSY